jgi:hypothetical protein
MLWMFKRVMHGTITAPEVASMTDLSVGEKWTLVPLAAVIIWLGVYPMPIVEKLNGPTEIAAKAEYTPKIAPIGETTGSLVAILGRTYIPNHHDSRDLHYLPSDIDYGQPITAAATAPTAAPAP